MFRNQPTLLSQLGRLTVATWVVTLACITPALSQQLELLIDLEPGEGAGVSSAPFFVAADRLYFSGCRENSGCEPWTSDGTAAGTLPLGDLRDGPESSNPRYLGSTTNGAVLFDADDGLSGRELWQTDGTQPGTFMVANIRPGVGNANLRPQTFETLGTLAVFQATNGTTTELYVYDTSATAGPQVLLGQHGRPLGSLESTLGRLVVTNSPSGGHGDEAHLTDGSTVTLIEDYNPGHFDGVSPGFDRHATSGGRVFFVGSDASGEQDELHSTDGLEITPHGLIAPGQGDADIDGLIPFAGGVVFTIDNGATARELWFAGPGATPRLLLAPGNGHPTPNDFIVAGNLLYFSARTNLLGDELWRTDGTTAGTQAIDLHSGSAHSGGRALAFYQDRLYFQGVAQPGGLFQLWRTDGTLSGSELVPVAIDGEHFDGKQGAVVDGRLILAVATHETGTELWILDLSGLFSSSFETGDLSEWQ